jgi:hypothetical protein
MAGPRDSLFNHCDVSLVRLGEGEHPAKLDLFANEKGRAAVQALFPDLPIQWLSPKDYDLGFVPPGWLWATLNIQKMAELSKSHTLAKVDSDPDASMNIWLYRLSVSLHRDGVRVIVGKPDRGFQKVEWS